jgi:hypothetical protein
MNRKNVISGISRYYMGRVTKIQVEANSLQGRGVVKVNLEKDTSEVKLKKFLDKNEFHSAQPKTIIERLKMLNQARVRLESLGFTRDKPLELPALGQAHELEFPELRSKLADVPTVTHGFEFFSSEEKINGVTSLKVVSETLGEKVPDATTEVILGPASGKDQYVASLSKVELFRQRIEASPNGQAIPIALALGVSNGAQGVVWHEQDEDFEGACVHTSRGVPIRDMSSMLREQQSRLSKEAKSLLNFASVETDSLVSELALEAPHGKKLWETLNLAIWMSACEGVVHSLMPDEHAQEGSNETINSWTKYAGKNFFGVVSRFSAGDLLRSGGLQVRDVEQIRALLAGPSEEQNKRNFERIVSASSNAVKNFIGTMESSKKNDHREIAKLLTNNWESTGKTSPLYWIRYDLKLDFMPKANLSRYPADKLNKYGNVVNANAHSSSYAHSQFVPRRERLGSDTTSKAPVSGAFEFRASEHVGNARVQAHFKRGKKRGARELDASWNHFESYVGRIAKRARVAPKT